MPSTKKKYPAASVNTCEPSNMIGNDNGYNNAEKNPSLISLNNSENNANSNNDVKHKNTTLTIPNDVVMSKNWLSIAANAGTNGREAKCSIS